MALVVLPTGTVGGGILFLAVSLIVVGTGLSIDCLWWLGRSFAIMASARRSLVTGGPYGVVRHPLYAAEAVTAIGVLISNWSLAALCVGLFHFALQFRRMTTRRRCCATTSRNTTPMRQRCPWSSRARLHQGGARPHLIEVFGPSRP